MRPPSRRRLRPAWSPALRPCGTASPPIGTASPVGTVAAHSLAADRHSLAADLVSSALAGSDVPGRIAPSVPVATDTADGIAASHGDAIRDIAAGPYRDPTCCHLRANVTATGGISGAHDPAAAAARSAGFRTVAKNLVPSLANAAGDLPVSYSDGCHLDFGTTESPPCVYGDPNSTTTAILFGDSHAAQWLPALQRIAQANDWRLVSLTKSGCPPVPVTVWNAPLNRPYRECNQWRQNSLQRIEDEQPAYVFVAAARDYEVRRRSRQAAVVRRTRCPSGRTRSNES